jgi:hypothetical protein
VVLLNQVMEHYLQITQTFHHVYWAKRMVQRRHILKERGLGYRSVVAFPSLASIIRLYENYESPCSVTAGKFHKCFHFLSVFIARNLIIRYVSLNITEKLIVPDGFFTRNQTQDSFGFVNFAPVISAPKHNFFPGAILLSCSVSELRKLSSVGFEAITVFY